MTEGKKFDKGKPRMDLLPGSALTEVAKVLGMGAFKYGDHNWRKGMNHSRLIGAALRHIHAYNDGQDLDDESGLSHLAHAACCLLFLTTYKVEELGIDDRHKIESNCSVYNSGVRRPMTEEEQDRVIEHHLGFTYQPDLAGANEKKNNVPKSGAQ